MNDQSPFLNVIHREWIRITSRRLYLGVCVALPLFIVFFMSTIFGNGQMEHIPIGLVDMDNSATSRAIARQVTAVPTFDVVSHFTNDAAAREAVQAKEIYGYLLIPSHFEQQVMDGKGPILSYYYQYALLSVGSEVMAAFETVLEPLALSPVVMQASELGIGQRRITSFLMPVTAQSHPLFNPDLDYSIYLTYPFFFILFQVLILLITVYAVGSEIKFHTADSWLRAAEGNMFVAVVGKLLPYTIVYSLISLFATYIFFGVMNIPASCGFLPLVSLSVLFVVATQALGLFLFSLFPSIGIIISVVSMVGSLGATLSGVTFPVPFMFPIIYRLSFLFPVRHFVEISQNLLYGDFGYTYTWMNVASLFLFLLPPLLLLPHLKRAIISSNYEEIT